MVDLQAMGDLIRNGLKAIGSDISATLQALDRYRWFKPVLYGAGIGGGLALAGLGASEGIHALEVSNYGGQPLNPVEYFSPVPYSPYYGYSPYLFGFAQSFDTIFNPLTILIIALVIIIIILIIMAGRF